MGDGAPVAVVIPTHNRVALLRRLTDALAGQQDIDFDVVVVDDGSTDATPEELRRLASDDRLRIVPLRLDPNGGPARARNAGWRATSADVVVFTDDDCVPQPGWLTALVNGVDDADVAIGQTLPNPDQRGQGGPFPHFVRVTRDRGTYQTCNIAYRRQVLEQVGGFSEDFRHAYAEDADLGWAARESGAHIAFEPNALVYHDVWRWSFRKYVGHGRALEDVVLLAKRHPAIRETYPRRWSYRASHPPALAALAGLAVAAAGRGYRMRLAGLSMTIPYLRHRLVDNPLPVRKRFRPVVIPAAFVRDVAEIAVMVRASVRYRTLLV